MDSPLVWAEVNLEAIAHNVSELRGITNPKARLMAVVKANAYGHGMIEVARRVLENGTDSMGVARIEEGIELNDTYWSMLSFMREYFLEHDIAPDVRHLIKYLAAKDGCSKKEAKQLVFELFPYGYVKQACKIAGMKKPRAWSTG